MLKAIKQKIFFLQESMNQALLANENKTTIATQNRKTDKSKGKNNLVFFMKSFWHEKKWDYFL